MFSNPADHKINLELQKKRLENNRHYGATAYKSKSTKSHHQKQQQQLKTPPSSVLTNFHRPAQSELMRTPSRQKATKEVVEYQKRLKNNRKYSATAYKRDRKSESAPTTPQAEQEKAETPPENLEMKLEPPLVEDEQDLLHSAIETLRMSMAGTTRQPCHAVPKTPLLAIGPIGPNFEQTSPASSNSDREFFEEVADVGMQVLEEVVHQESWLLSLLNARRLRVFFNYLASKTSNFQWAVKLLLVFVCGVLVGCSLQVLMDSLLADGAAASWEAFLDLIITVETYDPLN